jgi:hypothetical protein
LNKQKKILSRLIKVLVGLACFAIIYFRLAPEFTPSNLAILSEHVFSAQGFVFLFLAVLLIPVNWGIEAYKWKLITAPVQWVSYKTATKSVYSGVCLGNLAPGRATEFFAKIIYFKLDNRPRITVLHFVGGMFQLSITIITGFTALIFKLQAFGESAAWIRYAVPISGTVLLLLLILCIYKINWFLNYVSRKISKDKAIDDFDYRFTPKALLQLFGFSSLRYSVFFCQFFLLILLFDPQVDLVIFPSICLYFLITTVIPMISALEAAIRAAVAIVVFRESGISPAGLALSSLLIWLVNIIVPSIIGYIFLVRQNFNFKLFKNKAA